MIKTLIGIRLRSVIAGAFSNKGKRRLSPGKIILFSVLFLYLGAVFAGLSAVMAMGLGAILLPLGARGLYFGLFMAVTFSLVFILSIFETKSGLFECRDNELLISMPIKPRDIVISRISTILIYNLVEIAIIMLPCIVVYGVFTGDAVGIIGALLSSLLLAPLATALASAVGYLVAMIAKRLKRKNIVTVIFSLAFLFAYFALYGRLVGNIDAFFEGGEESANMLINNFGALGVLGGAALLMPLNFVIFAIVSIAVSAVAYVLISKSFYAIATDNRGAKRIKYKSRRLERGSALGALIKNEFARLFSSATYLLNSSLGVVFQLVFAVVVLVQSPNISTMLAQIETELGIEGIINYAAPILAAAVAVISSTTTMSASALSLEGKSFYIIKSMPLRASDVLVAKTAPQLIITVPVSIISVVLVSVALSLGIAEILLSVLLVLLASAIYAVFGTVINTAFPKFEFENEAQVVKQSLAMTVVLFSQMIFGLLLVGAAFALSLFVGGIIALIILSLFLIVILAALIAILFLVSTKRYETLS